jgi:hypothetical protein
MKRFIATIFVLSALASALAYQSIVQPKATASPAPIIDHSAELATLKSEISNLKSELAAANLPAMQVAELPAPAVAALPAAGVPTSTAAFVAAPRPVQSCAGGVCMPAAQGPRYQYQSRSSQPRRFVGRLFGRR